MPETFIYKSVFLRIFIRIRACTYKVVIWPVQNEAFKRICCFSALLFSPWLISMSPSISCHLPQTHQGPQGTAGSLDLHHPPILVP